MSLMYVADGIVAAIFAWALLSRLRSKKAPLPPGPPGEPILGHLRVVPSHNPEIAYYEWSKQYGDVLYFKVLNKPIVVLNSVQAAVDLLDKRGSNYGDRPRFALFECLGWGRTLTFLRWGPRFQLHRKLLQSYFTKPAIVKFRDIQTQEAHILVKKLMATPEDFDRLLQRMASAIVLRISFGHRIVTDDDPYIQMSADASYALGHVGAPAGTPVDFFPPLKYLPNWLARSSSLKFAREWAWAIKAIHDVPFANLKKEMAEGKAENSFLSTLMDRLARDAERGEKSELELADAKGAAAAIYVAGQDTTWSTLVVFMLCMTLHPEVQKKAQAEIDRVVGSDRLPDFSDRPHLPYVEYVIQEVLRYHPVSALGVPHRSLEEDVYRGMLIPKGSLVIANATAMCLDENTYQDPHAFNPDRYAPKSQGGNEEPFPSTFGFGRRICPGRHFADAVLWITMATIFATLDISKEVGPDGKEVPPKVAFTAGLTSHPEAFKCTIRPRSKHHEELVTIATNAAN